MDFKVPKRTVKDGPEAKGMRNLRKLMEHRGWLVKKIHGGQYQFGFPDLFCAHPEYGHRWIEMKAPKQKLRSSQIKKFSEFETYGELIFVLEDENGYGKLFKPFGNWKEYT